MTRIKRGVQSHKSHKKILKQAKGYRGARSKIFRVAKQAVIKSKQYAYRDRKQKKREFRSLWIVRINAAVRQYGINYSMFINMLKKTNISLNRKILSDLSIYNKDSFDLLMAKIKKINY